MAESFETEIDIGAPPEVVFHHLVDEGGMVAWMGEHARLDARPQGRFDVDITGVPVRGRYLVVDPPRRVVVTWGVAGNDDFGPGASTVEIVLTATPDGTHLRLVHSDLPETEVERHQAGWAHFLPRLAMAAASRGPAPTRGVDGRVQMEAMQRYRIAKRGDFAIGDWDPGDTSGFDGGRSEARAELDRLRPELEELQEKLYADGSHRVLVVLQGMDTSGKGGTIRKVFEGVDPAGVRVAAFKAPTADELARDFLWRIHPQVPRAGELVIFDRSHYEDVLIQRVHGMVPPKRWKARYRHIRNFEQMLSDEGTTVVKFFLHISPETQRERLQARLDNPDKHWKFRLSDLAERKLWDDYQQAYEDAIAETAARHAPWYVVPADRKWYRNLVVCRTIIATLEDLDLRYPPSPDDLTGVVVE